MQACFPAIYLPCVHAVKHVSLLVCLHSFLHANTICCLGDFFYDDEVVGYLFEAPFVCLVGPYCCVRYTNERDSFAQVSVSICDGCTVQGLQFGRDGVPMRLRRVWIEEC